MSEIVDKSLAIVGQRVPRVDAGERVTGRATYPADFTRPGMLEGAVKRSPHAHANIKRIDASKALALKGVKAVVSAAQFPDIRPNTIIPFGETGADLWVSAVIVMARGKVLWVGQPVAAVAAIDRRTAEAALDLIDVEYEVLPVAASIDAAMAPGAPVLHPEHKAKGFEPGAAVLPNVGSRTVVARGDTAISLASASRSSTISVTVDTGHQGYIEPHACVAEADPQGFVTIWTSTQGAFQTEIQTAGVLGLAQSKLKVVPLEIGGGFGGKITVHLEPLAARLSQLAGRPVRMVMSRAEMLGGGSGPPAAARIEIQVGATADGRITAIDGRYLVDTGGIPGTPTTLLMQASAACYQTETIRLEGMDVVTSKPRTEAYRGPGGIQAAFAVEQAMDELSISLDMDPLAFRRRNAAVTGSVMPIGTPFPSIGLTTILDRVASHDCWRDPIAPGTLPRGRGLALGYWRGTSMTSAAQVTLTGDGRVTVTMGTVDLSGTRTTMAQVAAEEFGLPLDDVHVVMADTKSSAYSDAAAGSRVGRTMAAAVVEACADALGQLKRRAAEKLQSPEADVAYQRGVFRARAGGSMTPAITLSELMRQTLTDGAVIGRGVSTKLPFGVEVGAHVVDVEVDPETGQVTILRYTAFQDVGRAINPAAVEGQMQGSVVQGLGWALTEAIDYDAEGRARNASLLDYRLPTALDVPPIECVIIETPVPGVPYGLRGVGEMPIVPVAAAVANAIRRAIGVRVTSMPMTPERVARALKTAAAG
ncbi:MAG: xanthine dehydrogenase family protein molybdopterin-binding subunit [Hyphomicrobiaceae bacterium]|nr:xanthine dehydrogenase family protein molybdopterin-binding subunit [Hyphomicrobiaceae bacterium]